MNETYSEASLPDPIFEPEDIVLDDVFAVDRWRPADDPEAPAVIDVGLNPVDRAFVYLHIDPAGDAQLARLGEEWAIPHGIWLDLHSPEAMELATRLRTLAETAAALDDRCRLTTGDVESDSRTVAG